MMIYRGNIRSDGRIMYPHELTYGNNILDTITGMVTVAGIEGKVDLTDTPIRFTFLEGYITIFYMDYKDIYTHVRYMGKFYPHKLNIRLDEKEFYCNNKKIVLSEDDVLLYQRKNEVLYINKDDRFCVANGKGSAVILYNKNCFPSRNCIFIEHNGYSFVYDRENKTSFISTSIFLNDLMLKYTKDIEYVVVYDDNVEFITSDGNYCYLDGQVYKLNPDETLKPVFGCKSARNI